MITYQVRPRTFRMSGGAKLPTLPADVVLKVLLGPPQPFGGEGFGRAVVDKGKALITFDANTGQQMVSSDPRLDPLDVRITESNRECRLSGREFSVSSRFESFDELNEFIQSLVLGLPWLLNVEFADPPYVERVNGEISGVQFVWELKQWAAHFAITTTEFQEKKFVDSLVRFSVVTPARRRRLLAALHYFHKACRLDRIGKTAGEFLAETLLNLSKTLEVLFPGEEGQGSVDAARVGLAALGYTRVEIERDFIPAILLRNHIDVGHVYLGVFTLGQLTTLHEFAEGSESVFRRLFGRMFAEIDAGRWDVPSYERHAPPGDILRIIERMAESRRRAAAS